MSAADLALNLAYLTLLGSTFTRAILQLRLALIGASSFFIVFGIVEGIWAMVAWNVLIAVLHAVRLYRYVSIRRRIDLDAMASSVRDRLFPDLDDFDFNALWALGETRSLTNNPLMIEHEPNDHVHLILEGRVEMEKTGRENVQMGPDDMVGEFSFVNGEVASATIRPIPTVTVRSWDHSRLATLDEVSPRAAKALNYFIHTQLIHKIATER